MKSVKDNSLFLNKLKLSEIKGGMTPNKSDQEGGYTDTKRPGLFNEQWDVAHESLLDISDTHRAVDSPLPKQKGTTLG